MASTPPSTLLPISPPASEAIRSELLRVFEAMREVDEFAKPKRVAAQVQALLRCAATPLGLRPLPGICLGIGGNRYSPACAGCQTPGRECPGRPEYTQDKHGKPFPGQLTLYPPDYVPPDTTPTGFFVNPAPTP